MANGKINIYSPDGHLVGYFVDPEVDAYAQGEYEIQGTFFGADGKPLVKLDFNPEALPYLADVTETKDVRHKRLKNVYVQRGRQPMRMSGVGEG